MIRRLLALVVLSVVTPAEAAEDVSAWALATVARCTGPDGSVFTTSIVSLPDGPIRFAQDHGDRVTELVLIPGDVTTVHARDADTGTWQSLDAAMEVFVRGHDVHRRALESGEATGRHRLALPDALGGGAVTTTLADPRPVLGVELPFVATFDQGDERYHYRFASVLPFRLAPGTEFGDDPAVVFDRLGDLQAIAALHARVLQAHLESDVESLAADEAARSVHSNRGRLNTWTREDLRARLGPYLESTTFTRYEDVRSPVLAVALDGSLGWLACEIEAEGTQRAEDGSVDPVSFGYSWVELLVRRDGVWRRQGTASSARD